jgi:hypothetical protein
MLLFALSSATAQLAAILGGCLVAIALLGVAFRALDVDPFSPASVFRFLFRSPSWKQLLVAVVMLMLALGAFQLFAYTGRAAEWITKYTRGDVDLTTALLMAALGLLVSLLILCLATVGVKRLSQHKDAEVAVGGREQILTLARRSREYWVEATVTLLLSVVALIPAALLANWAWNVLASVLMPVFLLSARHVHANRGSEI